ncbi:uncharacterized protein ACLA_032100 [Aspergillus clavatus NRRL 1]|uniref:Uncharacterized protein n=1 Tax=Aspergillus clavatus (strain ATCC 1007 / CBS 513.65 / DSM 816 / NCTC 3887 / NRRL 1 / QM 1276 / 107) TaxID=344612 RepID=A1CS54_ASPCL|nr:uncharacterized protein ACLA_032100 [Aspergillus clavatus NRRL 1]EAW08475.1 conserved hypothetical protein [Aspergillus clavatus NRRL 1]
MPMRWTSENDQLLLLKILETHELSVDSNKVAAAWPGTDPNERPTPRAIRERLVKMRQIVKASGSDGFSIGGNTAGNTPTPKKTRKNTTPAKTPASGKRKRGGKAGLAVGENGDLAPEYGGNTKQDVKHESDDDEIDTPTKKMPLQPGFTTNQPAMCAILVKSEADDDDVFSAGVDDTPSKRSRRVSALPRGMVKYEDDEDQPNNGYESSSSEFLPEGSAVHGEDLDMQGYA